MISAPARFNICQPPYFCGRTKLAHKVYRLQLLRKSRFIPAFVLRQGTKNPAREKPQAGFAVYMFSAKARGSFLYYPLFPIFTVALIEKFGQRRVFHDVNHVDEVVRELILRQLVALNPEYSALVGALSSPPKRSVRKNSTM